MQAWHLNCSSQQPECTHLTGACKGRSRIRALGQVSNLPHCRCPWCAKCANETLEPNCACSSSSQSLPPEICRNISTGPFLQGRHGSRLSLEQARERHALDIIPICSLDENVSLKIEKVKSRTGAGHLGLLYTRLPSRSPVAESYRFSLRCLVTLVACCVLTRETTCVDPGCLSIGEEHHIQSGATVRRDTHRSGTSKMLVSAAPFRGVTPVLQKACSWAPAGSCRGSVAIVPNPPGERYGSASTTNGSAIGCIGQSGSSPAVCSNTHKLWLARPGYAHGVHQDFESSGSPVSFAAPILCPGLLLLVRLQILTSIITRYHHACPRAPDKL